MLPTSWCASKWSLWALLGHHVPLKRNVSRCNHPPMEWHLSPRPASHHRAQKCQAMGRVGRSPHSNPEIVDSPCPFLHGSFSYSHLESQLNTIGKNTPLPLCVGQCHSWCKWIWGWDGDPCEGDMPWLNGSFRDIYATMEVGCMRTRLGVPEACFTMASLLWGNTSEHSGDCQGPWDWVADNEVKVYLIQILHKDMMGEAIKGHHDTGWASWVCLRALHDDLGGHVWNNGYTEWKQGLGNEHDLGGPVAGSQIKVLGKDMCLNLAEFMHSQSMVTLKAGGKTVQLSSTVMCWVYLLCRIWDSRWLSMMSTVNYVDDEDKYYR